MAFDVIIWTIYLVSLYYGVFWFLVYLDHGAEEEKKSRKDFPLVTIAIPAHNEVKTVIATIKSVLDLDYPKDKLEVLVVNNGSKDNTSQITNDFIKTVNYNIRLIDLPNPGKGAAMNYAIKQAKGEFFVTLDADSYVKSDALKVILPYFDNDEVASVLPIIKVRQKNSLMRKMQSVEYLLNFFYKKLISCLDCVHVTPGPFSVYRKSILTKIGGFDENNLTEDQEIAIRLQKYNYKILQILGTEVTTDAPKNYISFYKQRNRWYKGSLLNLWKHRDLMFNKKYGEFGMFHLPAVLTVATIAIIYSTYILYNYAIKPISNYLYDMSFINFNVSFIISEAVEKFSFLDLNYMTMFFGLSVMFVSLIAIRLAFKYTNEKLSSTLFATSLYLILYPTLLSITWLGVAFDLLRGKKQRW
ncbi:MAG: glycosyltransferase family 2 protein [Candidatus Nanoarchaeia archaeon]|nr:glycosyltransferase family 2 protein [Candidatus Nanoarchaeia archaeon]